MQMPQRKIINAPVLQKLQIDLILAAACAGLSMERHKVHTAIHMRQSLVNFFSVLTRNGRVLIAVSSPAVSEQLQIFRKFPVTKRACRLVVVPGQIQIVDLRRFLHRVQNRIYRPLPHTVSIKEVSCNDDRLHAVFPRILCHAHKRAQHFRAPCCRLPRRHVRLHGAVQVNICAMDQFHTHSLSFRFHKTDAAFSLPALTLLPRPFADAPAAA